MAGGNHLAARTNAVHFAERHEQQFAVPETHHLSLDTLLGDLRFDAADFTDRCHGPLGFNYQTDHLRHAAPILDEARTG